MSRGLAGAPHPQASGVSALFSPPQALYCSCFVPVYCGLIPPTYRGVVSAAVWTGLSQGPGVPRLLRPRLLGQQRGGLRIQREDQDLGRFLRFPTRNSPTLVDGLPGP